MKSDIESLDMEDHYRHMYKENMEILQQINVVSTLSNKDKFFYCFCFVLNLSNKLGILLLFATS